MSEARRASFANELGGVVLLVGRLWNATAARRVPRHLVAREIVDLGERSLPLVLTALAFFGMILAVQGGRQLRPVLGDISVAGPPLLEMMVREFGPAFTAIMFSIRAGAAIAARIAAMSVTEQLDALKLSAGDPVAEIVAPPAVASLVIALPLTLLGTLALAISGAYFASAAFEVRAQAFLDPQRLDWGDGVVWATKALVFALVTPAISARCGLQARGGALAVGEATTAAVVGSLVTIVGLDLALGALALAVGL